MGDIPDAQAAPAVDSGKPGIESAATAAPAPPLPHDAGVASINPQSTASVTPPTTINDDWRGLTTRDVRRVVAGLHPQISLSDDHPKLTVQGNVWIIEFEPGGCSDRTLKIELVFQNGRVQRSKESRGRYTGKECSF